MKKMKRSTLVILCVIAIFLMMVLGIWLLHTSLSFVGNKMKNDIIEIAEQKGYDIEFEKGIEFYVIEDGVKYYYRKSLGKVRLTKIYTEVSCKAEYEVVDDKGEITIIVVGNDKFEVSLDNDVILINNQGKEHIFQEYIRFVCSSEFTEESIDPYDIVTIRGKADKNYHKITKNFISGDELCELYERSMVIAKEFEK